MGHKNTEAGPSEPKGKSVDPREWGNINLSEGELDVEVQAATLNSYETRKGIPEYDQEKVSQKKKSKSKGYRIYWFGKRSVTVER